MIAPHQNMGAILTKMTNCKIVVVGDIMLDRFIHGQVDRISPEAPVPVLKLQGEHNMPGGAANVARNLAHLGVDVTLIGLVGNCLLYTSPSPRDLSTSRMPSSA